MNVSVNPLNHKGMRFSLLLCFFWVGCHNERSNVTKSPDADAGIVSATQVPGPVKQSEDSIFTSAHQAKVTNPMTTDLVSEVLTTQIFKEELQLIPTKDRRFMFDEIDLNNDGKKEIFVGLNGSYFCGTGGCTALILSSGGKVITRFTVTEFPIIVRPSKTRGWRDLVMGSAAPKPAMHYVKWNGKKYPANPSTQPSFLETPSEKSEHVLSCSAHRNHWHTF